MWFWKNEKVTNKEGKLVLKMTKKNNTKYNVSLLLSVVIFFVITSFVCLKTGRIWENNLRFGHSISFFRPKGLNIFLMSRSERFLWALNEAVGFSKFHSDFDQDRWITQFVFPNVVDGYFVDVGSGDGVESSNTKALEDLGWEGICIDPFPTNMEYRTCKLFKEIVYREEGLKVLFRNAGFLGGIEEEMEISTGGIEVKKGGKFVELTTTTLDDILERANAPSFIHYISIDIEGAELEALNGFSFSKYKVGAFTIEHNWEEPKRSQIGTLLKSKGYRFVHSLYRDDLYIIDDQFMPQ
jgi:FkbM family methyltransferase